MATSRASQYQRAVMSEPRVNSLPRQNFLSGIDDRFLFNRIGGEKEESKPNNYYNWKPSSTFAEPASAGAVRSKKSKNREREQNFTGQQDQQRASLSNGPSRRRTPATYPRTQHVTSAIDREELENLRYQMTFSDMDDQSTDSQVLGSVSRANGVNNNRPAETLNDDASRRPISVLDTIFVNEMPDRNKIVARLMQIRDYLKQANAMMVTLQNATESTEKAEQVVKLRRLQDHLQEQERGYLALLERMLAEELGTTTSLSGFDTSSVATSNDLNLNVAPPESRGSAAAAAAAAVAAAAEQAVNGRSSQNSGESFATSVAESASINIDARSDISEATTGQKGNRVSEQIEALEGLRKQHDLLKKMLKQQEELRTLQDRQAALMTLQSQLERRMTNTEQEKAEETLSVSTQATTTATSVTEDVPPITTTAGRYHPGVPLTAADLQERRRTLLRMLTEQEQEPEPEQVRSTGIQQPTRADWLDQRAEVAPPLISSEHQELREKLEALQAKKRQMDDLLAQLHALNPNIPNLGGDTSSVASTTSNANENLVAMMLGQGNETSDDNEATLTNGPDSLRLTELLDLVQQY